MARNSTTARHDCCGSSLDSGVTSHSQPSIPSTFHVPLNTDTPYRSQQQHCVCEASERQWHNKL